MAEGLPAEDPRLSGVPRHGVVFVLFEESSGTATNHVPAIAISEDVNAGMQSDVAHSHYSLLRTLQLNWDMPCLADSCSANTIGELFH